MMWERSCEREADVRRMARAAGDDPALCAHVERCAMCRETIKVMAWMQEMAAQPLDSAPPRDATFLWWKAQLLRKWDAQRQAAAPLEAGGRVQVGIGLAGAVTLLVLFWRELPALGTSPFTIDVRVWSSLPGGLMPVMVLSAVLLVATTVIVVRELIPKE